MQKILIASGNKGKVMEMKAIFSREMPFIEILSLQDFNIDIMPTETGKTFIENSFIKAFGIYRQVLIPVLADDSGLMVDNLDGAPGVYSSRFSGKDATDESNNKLLLKKLENFSLPEERKAQFVCTMTLVRDTGSIVTSSGLCKGTIGFNAKGTNGFGYDPLMIPNGQSGKTMAQLPYDVKNNISHRNRALLQMLSRIIRLDW